MRSVGILGAGSFGTALAVHAARAERRVVLWARRPELVEAMAAERLNPDYLPGVELPARLEPSADLAAVAACEVVLVAVPSHGFREAVRGRCCVAPETTGGPGLRDQGHRDRDQARMSEVVFEEAMAADREVRFAVLAGPSFAAELARGMPTAAVVASGRRGPRRGAARSCRRANLRLYSSTDVVGVELGGTARTSSPSPPGWSTGLGLGHNTLAALITRGLHEITRLGVACGGQPRTFAGLAGLGDLVLTCTGGLSRNRQAGIDLARGQDAGGDHRRAHMVAEGIRNSLAMARLARKRASRCRSPSRWWRSSTRARRRGRRWPT